MSLVGDMNAELPRPTKKRQLAAEERQRAVRACAECRRLKEKCEDGIPCKRCRHLRRPCELAPASAPVDRRTSDLTGSFKDLKDRSKYMELILKHHFPDLKLDTDTLRRTYDSLSLSTSRIQDLEAPTDSNEASDDGRPPESPGIEDENCTLDDVDDTTTHYSGEFSHWNFSMHIKRNIDELIATSNVPGMDKVKRLPDFIRVGEADPNSTSMSDIIALLPPRPVATFLITVFFKHATSFYYYVDRSWLDSFLDRIYTDSITMGSKDITAACVVLMVWAVGTQYVHLESPRQYNNRALGSVDSNGGWELQIGSAFYRQVAKLLSEVIHSGSLLSVQVFLLLGLYSLPIDASGIGYIYLNLAVKLAIQNGLHRKLVRADIDANAKETRRRLWWTIYCMERKIGIYHGRPRAIIRSDIDAELPQKRDTSDASIYSFEPSGLLESINLTNQAEEFLQEITRLRLCPRSEMGPVLDRIKHMKSNLRGSWMPSRDGTSIPTNTANHLGQTTSRAEIHSRLECCLLHMFIGRPFILAHRQRQVKTQSSPKPKNTGHTRSDMLQDQWDFLVKDCIAAATEAITICHAMQTGSRGIAKASYTEYSSCRASLLVLIAYSICYRTNEFSSTLQRGLDVIREMASVGDSARSEVSLLETLEAALHRLHVFDSSSDPTADMHHQDQSEEGYEGFVNWYSQLAGSTGFSTEPPGAGYGTIIPEMNMPSQESHLQSRFVIPGVEANNTHQDVFVDDFPFDFGLLNPDTNVAFFTPDLNGYGNPERELFKNFL